MKNIGYLVKKWLKSSPGFTLAELMVAMTVGGFVMGGVFAVWYQMFNVTATNSNYMAAFRQVQNGGDWISNDALMSQGVYEMASVVLPSGGIGIGDTTIPVNSTADDSINDFPSSGIICIDDELIQYTGIDPDNSQFTGCIRGADATSHDSGASVTVFVSLNWTTWEGDQRQVVYNLKETSRELVRSYLTRTGEEAEDGDPYSLVSSTTVAEAIVVDDTTSEWDYGGKELEVKITASVGGYVLGKFGIHSQTATRTYEVNPRPFF
jgi:prepilin-type N-terminal cleavage/methylation domain-containing protein